MAAAQVKIAVIGMSGQGKSTLLNALADTGEDDDVVYHFSVGAESTGHTDKVATKTFKLNAEGSSPMELSLVDTMGFPDPDPERCVAFYDKVVMACEQELNAIIWVHRAGRENYSDIEKVQCLMREFNNAKPPIYLVVNGCESYTRMSKAQKEAKKKNHLEEHQKIGEELVKLSGIQVTKIIASCEMDDLYDDVKVQLARWLGGTTPKSSVLKTHEQLGAELDACKTADQQAAYELQKMKEAQNKAEDNRKGLQEKKQNLEIAATATAASAAGLALVPFAGPALAAAAAVTAAGLAAASKAMRGDIDAAIKEAEQVLKSLMATEGDKSATDAAYKSASEQFHTVNKIFEAVKAHKQ